MVDSVLVADDRLAGGHDPSLTPVDEGRIGEFAEPLRGPRRR
jgi:hypothetical protein